jgi:dipeptidyl-peptidase 4
MKKQYYKLMALAGLISLSPEVSAQINWSPDGKGCYEISEQQDIQEIKLSNGEAKTIVKGSLLKKANGESIKVKDFAISPDASKVLIYTNAQKVWRLETRGDYYILDLKTQKLTQLGQGKPEASLMFAKFSPDSQKVAYVSKNNIFSEDIKTGKITALTTNGAEGMINGTFDWVYEEEFECRDGFRWSPDSQSIAYWQVDARKTKVFNMVNNTDGIYAKIIPIEYPKVGEDPSAVKIGVVNVASAKTKWMNIPGDAIQNYLPRMQYCPKSNDLIVQQFSRDQTETKVYIVNTQTAEAKVAFEEKDTAWIEAHDEWIWINNDTEFTFTSEKNGFRQLLAATKDGKVRQISQPTFDIIDLVLVDNKSNEAYFIASPENYTQKYLYKIGLDGQSQAQRISPANQAGTHKYLISPDASYAWHSFNSNTVKPVAEVINLKTGQAIRPDFSIDKQVAKQTPPTNKVEFFTVKTEDGIDITGWMKKPNNFDPAKKYPVVFYVYGEPASATALDVFSAGKNRLYQGDMAEDGYVYISMDNRGAPLPRGKAWRKAIYKNIGRLNVRDQAMATKKLLEQHSFLDKSRVAVHGWSGGGSSTLNLLFQYPEIYQTGISIAPVANQLTYDNIYQERYMGSPLKTKEDYIQGSPVTRAKNLQGNLLLIHGTGDDNVHYQNAEMLINELIKYKKPFQMMSYPNRDHGISDVHGEGTNEHLRITFTKFLKDHCPPGAR